MEGSDFPLFQYTQDEAENILKELGVKESNITEDVDALLEWFQKQPHLSEAGTDRDYLERVLIMAKGSREKAKQRINNFYNLRGMAPEIIQARMKVFSEGAKMFTFHRFSTIPILFEGKRIIVMQFLDPNPESMRVDILYRDVFMMADLRMKYEYSAGDIWIMDLKNAGYGHFLRSNLLTWNKAGNLIQKGIGQRIYAIHVLNPFPGLEKVLTVFKTFMKQKIMDRIVIHKDEKELLKSLPKSHLPRDYGGDQPSVLEYTELFQKLVSTDDKVKQLLIDVTKRVSDETKRPGGEELMAGTFKKLELD